MSSTIRSYVIRYQEQGSGTANVVKIKVTNVQNEEEMFFDHLDDALSFIREAIEGSPVKRGEVID